MTLLEIIFIPIALFLLLNISIGLGIAYTELKKRLDKLEAISLSIQRKF